MFKIKNFGIFVISSSKILWKCIVPLKKSILRNLLNKMNHPKIVKRAGSSKSEQGGKNVQNS